MFIYGLSSAMCPFARPLAPRLPVAMATASVLPMELSRGAIVILAGLGKKLLLYKYNLVHSMTITVNHSPLLRL